MSAKTIIIDKKKVRVEANASTLLIYEDRRLLQDIDELAKITTTDKVPFSLYSKLFWSVAKTADDTVPDIYEWAKDFSISGVIEGSRTAIELICKSIETTKKSKATVGHRFICLLTTFFRSLSKAD